MADNSSVVEVDGVKGVYKLDYHVKADAEPLSDTKLVYLDEDWEWSEIFVPLTEEEIKDYEKLDAESKVPERLESVESVTEEIVLYLADAIGGSDAD